MDSWPIISVKYLYNPSISNGFGSGCDSISWVRLNKLSHSECGLYNQVELTHNWCALRLLDSRHIIRVGVQPVDMPCQLDPF